MWHIDFDTLLWKSSYFQIGLLSFVYIVLNKRDTVYKTLTLLHTIMVNLQKR